MQYESLVRRVLSLDKPWKYYVALLESHGDFPLEITTRCLHDKNKVARVHRQIPDTWITWCAECLKRRLKLRCADIYLPSVLSLDTFQPFPGPVT